MIRNLKAEELVGLIDALKGLLDDYKHELRTARIHYPVEGGVLEGEVWHLEKAFEGSANDILYFTLLEEPAPTSTVPRDHIGIGLEILGRHEKEGEG